MHIAMILSNAFRPDPRVLKEAVSLRGSGFDVTIICWDRSAELEPMEALPSGVKIIRIQNVHSSYGIGTRQILILFRFWQAVIHKLIEIKPDALHCHDFDTLPAGLWYRLFHHIAVVYDAHEYYADLVKPRLKGPFGLLLYQLIKHSEYLGAHLSSAIVTVDKILAAIFQKHNNNVIILDHYPEKVLTSQENHVFSRSQLTLLYAGRLSIDRGLLIYIDLVRKLQEREIPCRLVLVGAFSPQSDKSRFYDYAQDSINFIDFLGWVPYHQMSQIYHNADIGLAILYPEPRYKAAVPVKLFEYMACGIPVIISNFPAVVKIIDEVGCGLLIDPLSDLEITIDTIIDWWRNRSLPQAIGENGRQAVLSKYNWESQIDRLINLYRQIS